MRARPLVIVLAAVGAAAWLAKTAPPGGAPPARSPEDVFRTVTEPRLVAPLSSMFPGLVETSGVRSDESNAAAGGVPTSQHLTGEAVDLAPPAGVTAGELLRRAVQAGLPIDQGIAYAVGQGGHVHLSTSATGRNRGQIFAKGSDGGALVPGLAAVAFLAVNPRATRAELLAASTTT